MCIVGAGYTGLWTAYYLKRADPGLRIIVLEASLRRVRRLRPERRLGDRRTARSRARYAAAPGGTDGVRELERQLRDTVDEVARVCADEGIDAGLVKGGTLTIATSAAQEARLRHRSSRNGHGAMTPAIVRYLEKTSWPSGCG